MKEVEVKILEINPEEIKEKLEKLGAKKAYEETQVVRILDYEDNKIRSNDTLLRVRKIGDKTELTFKGKKEDQNGFKIRQEIETHVEDFETILKIFEKLDIKPKKSYDKHRTSYKLDDSTIEIDYLPNMKDIPTWLEIESESEESVLKIVEKLGFKKEDTAALSGNGLMKHYGYDPDQIK